MAPFTRPTFQQHAYDLAKAWDVRIIESNQLRPEEAFAIAGPRIVVCGLIHEETTYAVALHEIGHLAHPVGSLPGPRTLTMLRAEEEAAWNWARHYALEWTPVMEHIAQFAEATYRMADDGPAPPPAAVPAAPAPKPAPITPIKWEEWT